MYKNKKAKLEICAFHIDSCIIAERAGAARVELCDNPLEGGTTPSYATIKTVREKISILLYPIVRPRAGNFLYSNDEFAILKEDVKMCKQLGCDGISTGVQKLNGEIDTERLQRIAEWAYPMGVTCHRVFDCTPDPFKALEDIINGGCERILTSGLQSSAPKGSALLQQLIKQAGNRIVIMPGAGVNSSNIAKLKEETGATEFHSSAKRIAPNPVTYLNKEVSDYGHVYIADEEEVRAMVTEILGD